MSDKPPKPPRKLLDQVRDRIRAKHYSLRTEHTYVQWIRRFILFHGKRHPREMGAAEGRKGVGHDICARLYFNKAYRRNGTPWVGRYSATVVDRERYRLDVIRYLALNPARAGRVEELKIWPREAVTLLPEALES